MGGGSKRGWIEVDLTRNTPLVEAILDDRLCPGGWVEGHAPSLPVRRRPGGQNDGAAASSAGSTVPIDWTAGLGDPIDTLPWYGVAGDR
jgi:hypothetical protein